MVAVAADAQHQLLVFQPDGLQIQVPRLTPPDPCAAFSDSRSWWLVAYGGGRVVHHCEGKNCSKTLQGHVSS